ncbi:MAG: CRISPR-associated protein [Nostoc sp.]|uniref:CRISPR-associated protein n=1 Tax=Nostoc sp. TaxID=1180 RepID=UPI002FFCEB91
MRRVIISTIGTSLLTNQIKRSDHTEKDWYNQLRDYANFTLENTSKEVVVIIEKLKIRAIEKLKYSLIPQIRLANAELNGIYGLYKERLQEGQQDIHWLISTDTAQGKATAEIVKEFLREKGLVNTSIYTPNRLSTATTEAFSEGIDNLLNWLQKEVIPLKDSYRICFNLVGSFKSLQGYLNTIGMFHAHEIIYIFEGKESNLIKIPRLPIKVDESQIEPYVVQFALMDAGAGFSLSEVADISEALIGEYNSKKVLSTWGQLIWNQCKTNLLSQNLLIFPKLHYEDNFRADYNRIRDKKEKVQLQEDLAKVSNLLSESNGNTNVLKEHPGFRYDKYTNSNDDVAHFRVSKSLRISCISANGILILRRYGKEPEVNKNP